MVARLALGEDFECRSAVLAAVEGSGVVAVYVHVKLQVVARSERLAVRDSAVKVGLNLVM